MPATWRRHGGRPACAALLALLALLAAPTTAAPRARDSTPLPRVTVFGDSVATALFWAPAGAILQVGIDLDLQAAGCERIEDASCDIDGRAPPNVLSRLDTLGADLGQTVVMVIGYNEFAGNWVGSVNDVLDAFARHGVKRVIWLNMKEAEHPDINMNDQLAAIAATHPEVTVLDWNAYSRSHDDWFQGDGLHLIESGALAMATFIHSALVDAGVVKPPQASAAGTTTTTTTTTAAPRRLAVLTGRLPATTTNKPYRTFLRATGGVPPYRWRRFAKLPPGIVLASDGLVAGMPRVAGTFRISVTVTDGKGSRASRHVFLSVRA